MVKKLMKKYWDTIPYLFFGVCTTVSNVAAYWICAHALGLKTMVSTVIAWIIAVMFAYVTNRKWVFHSEAHEITAICKEMASFFGCRFATGVIDWLCMFFFVEVLNFNDVITKFTANCLVIVLNYIASKFIIFRRK